MCVTKLSSNGISHMNLLHYSYVIHDYNHRFVSFDEQIISFTGDDTQVLLVKLMTKFFLIINQYKYEK